MDRRSFIFASGLGLAGALASGAAGTTRKTRNVILVTCDGLRWQDAFRGADAALLTKKSGVADPDRTRAEFWRDTEQARREALMPFVWSEIARRGQLFGNRDKGSEVFVTNGRNFSYPGYSELLAGHPDDRVDSNDKKNNPNVTVLEFLNRDREFEGKVAAFAAWDVFPYIINAERSGVLVNAGYDALKMDDPQVELLNRMKVETGIWEGEPMDAPVFHLAMHYLRARKPRLLYLALGETDEWAHSGRYDLYLTAAKRSDDYIRELWNAVNRMPEYRGNTTLIVAVDHGRGAAGETWRGHGQKTPDSKYTWFGVLGPDTLALGERKSIPAVEQTQIAPTLASFLGRDYRAANPKVGALIADVLPR